MQIVGTEHTTTPRSCLRAIVGGRESRAYLYSIVSNRCPQRRFAEYNRHCATAMDIRRVNQGQIRRGLPSSPQSHFSPNSEIGMGSTRVSSVSSGITSELRPNCPHTIFSGLSMRKSLPEINRYLADWRSGAWDSQGRSILVAMVVQGVNRLENRAHGTCFQSSPLGHGSCTIARRIQRVMIVKIDVRSSIKSL